MSLLKDIGTNWLHFFAELHDRMVHPSPLHFCEVGSERRSQHPGSGHVVPLEPEDPKGEQKSFCARKHWKNGFDMI